MAEKSKKVTFYATSLDGKLKKRMGAISWKYGKGYKDNLTDEIKYEQSELDIYFEDGKFTTENPDQIAYLRAYTNGGTIELSDGRRVIVPVNNQLFRISETDPEAVGVKTVTEKVEVTKEIIPKALLDLMDLQMKIDFAKRNQVELPKEQTQASLDQVLTEAGHVV
jgi:hypothetical protein